MSSSDSEDENIIRYGTPLEPYEEDEIPSKRKYQQPQEQYAVDAHGRRRFHGAFTGGFSAGFGNTVGTPEGWTPSSFKSSRTEKAQMSSQRPEDFMDEEDRSEFGIAPKLMQTQGEFSGQKRPHPTRYHDGPIPGEPVLEQLLRPIHESAAVKMLKAMGWREGQGTGDRVTRREKKKAKQQHKVYGCFMPPEMREQQENSEESSDSEFEYETLFAPEDYEPYMLQHKNDRFGLGYSGLSRHSVLGNMVGEYGSSDRKSHLMMKEKGRKISIRGQAFGVGAFEADDEDIYATEDMSHYDFVLGGSSKQTDKKAAPREKNVLEGFVKATKPLPVVPSYPPPTLPRDYRPAPAGSRQTRFEHTDQPQRDQGLGRHELTAEARGNLLGELPLPKTNIQIPPQNQPNIEKILGKNINFVSTEKIQNEDFISIKDSIKDSNSKDTNKVFRPFATNPAKQARYEKYLERKEIERDSDMDKVSAWERDRELLEFEQAAKLYRPLSGIMGDRFTHATQPDDALNPLTAVAKSSINYGLASPEMIEAAKMGAFGLMTRRIVDWRPESIVCKRFNIPEPGGSRPEEKKEDKPKVSYSIFSYMESSVHDKESFTKEQSKFSGSKSIASETPKQRQESTGKIDSKKPEVQESNKRLTVADLFLKESEKVKETGQEVTETIEKFDKMDLYKAIFLSDSENEEENKTTENKDENSFYETPKNTERNDSPPRGIFANINFDEINSWKRNITTDKDKTETQATDKDKLENSTDNKEAIGNNTDNNDCLDVYGPKIPENIKLNLESSVNEGFKPKFRRKDERKESSSSDSWVDAKEIKSKKHKKKSKKHKTKHKKEKSKHKKKDK